MSALSRLFQEWLSGFFGPLVLPFMLFVLWGGNKSSSLNWLMQSRKRWLVLWTCYGLGKGIALGVFVLFRYLSDVGGGTFDLGWPTSSDIWSALHLGYSPGALLVVGLLRAMFEGALDCGLAALSWWVFEWSSPHLQTHRTTTIHCGLALLIPSSVGIIGGGPTILWPMPALIMIPSYFVPFEFFGFALVAVPTIAFLLWNPQLLRGETGLPKRTYFLFASTVLLSIGWFAAGWNFGLKYQGPLLTYTLCIINGLWALFLSLLFIRSWKGPPSFAVNLTLHWVLFAWLGWYAFPHLGELP